MLRTEGSGEEKQLVTSRGGTVHGCPFPLKAKKRSDYGIPLESTMTETEKK